MSYEQPAYVSIRQHTSVIMSYEHACNTLNAIHALISELTHSLDRVLTALQQRLNSALTAPEQINKLIND